VYQLAIDSCLATERAGEIVCRPYGTWFRRYSLYPALPCRAIICRLPGLSFSGGGFRGMKCGVPCMGVGVGGLGLD
jgi:hypothetical protein